MFYSLLAMMLATLVASQDAPGLAVAAVIDLKTEAQDEAKSYVALMEGKDAGVKTGLRGADGGTVSAVADYVMFVCYLYIFQLFD